MKVPDSFTPVTGYRTWALGLGWLWSSQSPEKVAWPATEPLRARCLKHGFPSLFNPRMPQHSAPDRDCACGIHAVYAPWDLELIEPRRPWALISGRVEGWGRVALGERGFGPRWRGRLSSSSSRGGTNRCGAPPPMWPARTASPSCHGRRPPRQACNHRTAASSPSGNPTLLDRHDESTSKRRATEDRIKTEGSGPLVECRPDRLGSHFVRFLCLLRRPPCEFPLPVWRVWRKHGDRQYGRTEPGP